MGTSRRSRPQTFLQGGVAPEKFLSDRSAHYATFRQGEHSTGRYQGRYGSSDCFRRLKWSKVGRNKQKDSSQNLFARWCRPERVIPRTRIVLSDIARWQRERRVLPREVWDQRLLQEASGVQGKWEQAEGAVFKPFRRAASLRESHAKVLACDVRHLEKAARAPGATKGDMGPATVAGGLSGPK